MHKESNFAALALNWLMAIAWCLMIRELEIRGRRRPRLWKMQDLVETGKLHPGIWSMIDCSIVKSSVDAHLWISSKRGAGGLRCLIDSMGLASIQKSCHGSVNLLHIG
ncbi:uncharacterized protein BDR25DRAFT_354694 [Lindgomyces ingoldianus]|uniref:Uncharacterized protein n=1 Tax=Lindgomyces ingoldianus TaxID=673940 RepID=A0ACB6QYW7_9PLEO|nr:uncharacterized protein BDR25DRAFT_354694 [Lindgomyces ingoldianus]KAF2471462.1 hypothetical protein BDR25DRAFT_354694 [Lindgomyces ingoldianus]